MRKFILALMILCGLILKCQAFPGDAVIQSSGNVLEANFTQLRYLDGIPQPIKSEGHMVLCEDEGLIWTTTAPFPNSIMITKKGMYQLEGKTKTVLVKAGGSSAFFDVMAGIFNMNEDRNVKGFSVKELPPSNDNWRICLIPQYGPVQNFIKSITVEGKAYILHVTIMRPNGDHDEIDINGHVIKDSLPPELRNLFYE